VDTTLADDDSAGLGGCYWRPRHTVWWTYTPTASGRLHTSVGSDLPSASPESFPGPWLAVARLTATGPVPLVPSGPTPDEDCPSPVSAADVRVEPGTTYLIGVFAAEYWQEPALAVGGRLTLDAGFLRDTAPTAPTGVLVHRDDRARTATLTWTPPSSDGGSPITGYQVARDGTDTGGTGPWSTVLPATARIITFKYLLPWRSYHLSVRAINAIGTGPAAGGNVMLTAPTASEPRSVSATAGNRSATVRWTAPSHTGSSAVRSYRIRRYAGSTQTLQATSTVAATARGFSARGLANGRSYRFDVTAVNASGTGLVSARTKPVTPAP